MDWLAQWSGPLLGLLVLLVTIGFLIHMTFSHKPDARMAFLTGLMRGALEDETPEALPAPAAPLVHSAPHHHTPSFV
jgi:hypothetical protein